mmetsp:Transcript_2078/g.4711  ORF Transcript_2078/g.4711 Transcript_2078/m.4711 type:complete len:201 (+) Transcript_2078:1203-1805(+)
MTSSSFSYSISIRWKDASLRPKSSNGSLGRSSSRIFLCASTKERLGGFFFFFSALEANFFARTLTSCCTMPCTLTVSLRMSKTCFRDSVPSEGAPPAPLEVTASLSSTRFTGGEAVAAAAAVAFAFSSSLAPARRKVARESGITPAPRTPNLWSFSERRVTWVLPASVIPTADVRAGESVACPQLLSQAPPPARSRAPAP